jgi:hypothetical protein
MMSSPLVLVLRWIAILPGGCAVAVITAGVARIVAFDPKGGGVIGTYLLQGVGSGAAFVYAGICIAPKWQKKVGICLAIVVLLGTFLACFAASRESRWTDVFAYVAVALGALVVAANDFGGARDIQPR